METSHFIDTSSTPTAPPLPTQDMFEQLRVDKSRNVSKHFSETSRLVREHLCHLKVDQHDSTTDNSDNMRKFVTDTIFRMGYKHKSEHWKNLIRDDKLFYILHNFDVKPILQIGPSCGVAALSMAVNALAGSQNSISELEQIVEMAKSLSLTNHGEMFSAQALLSLANKLSSEVTGCVLTDCASMVEKKMLILMHLLQKHLVLIPYDKGPNNEPCHKKGLKAHWALLTGFLIATNKLEDDLRKVLDENELNLFSFQTTVDPSLIEKSFHCLEENYQLGEDSGDNFELFVFARQSKSLRLHLWHLNELLESNNQLLLDPEEDCYLLFEGGVHKGLCGKVIILKKSD